MKVVMASTTTSPSHNKYHHVVQRLTMDQRRERIQHVLGISIQEVKILEMERHMEHMKERIQHFATLS